MDDDFERSLDSDTLRFIRRKARQLAGRYGFQRHEAEDIQQSLILDCLERLARFNPHRGVRANFTRFVIKHGVANLIEAQRSSRSGYDVRHVSLNSPIDHNDSDASEFIDVISERDCRDRAVRSLNLPEQSLVLKLDVERVIASLPPDLRRICLLLVVLDRVAHVAAAIGVSRATLHRRMCTIRAVFVQARLSDYVRETTDDRKANSSNGGGLPRKSGHPLEDAVPCDAAAMPKNVRPIAGRSNNPQGDTRPSADFARVRSRNPGRWEEAS